MSYLKSNPTYASKILSLLKKHYPNAKIILKFSNPWELLVAVILSAQCTDVRVNKVTDKLFKKYKTIKDYANAPLLELEKDVKSTGFYRNKAKNIKTAAEIVLSKFNGKIPKTMDEMLTIPGVGRKTANVVLGNAYGIYVGIAVDTHVKKQSQKFGFTKNQNPDKIEQDLMRLFDKKEWFSLTYLLIEHGRAYGRGKNPICTICKTKLCKLRNFFL